MRRRWAGRRGHPRGRLIATVDVAATELATGVLAGDRRALARALTMVEDGSPASLRDLVARIYPATGTARVIGITGSPGVGKSTLTNGLAAHLRATGRTVGIIAVDPSSPFSGGALLGDRVRMQGHHADDGVFIRSMASRGHLGGLSFATPQAVLVLDAAGFDDVLIETVGVGQSEVEITATADTTIVMMAPGMGDGIQAAKAGILEIADVFVINKSDAGGAGKLESELRGMLEMGHAVADDEGKSWWPPIVRTVAVRDEGVDDLARAVDEHTTAIHGSDVAARRSLERARHAIREIVLERQRLAMDQPTVGLDDLSARVAARDIDPYEAADQVIDATS